MNAENKFDIIIVGTGAGGGTLGYALAPSGKRILFLERGDYVPREKANWSPRLVNVEGRYNTAEAWEDTGGKPLHSHTNYYVGAAAAVGMTVRDADRSIDFYSRVLSFEKVSDVEIERSDYERLEGVFGARMRVVGMRLGDESIELTEYLAPTGRPVAIDSHSNHRWFQLIGHLIYGAIFGAIAGAPATAKAVKAAA